MAAKKGVKGADKVLDAAKELIEGAVVDQQDRASFGNYGGATRQKIELQPLIDKLLEDVRRIDGDESLSRSEKTKRIGRLADSLKVKLYEDKRRKEEDKLRASSYRRYLTTVRKAITAQNWRHHGLEAAVHSLIKHHPRYAEQLNDMAAMTDITSLRLAHRDLLALARQQRDDSAFEAFKAMKLDHEIMRHLTLPAATKAQLATAAVETLEVRATNTIEINYHWMIETIHDLLSKDDMRSEVLSDEIFLWIEFFLAGAGPGAGHRAPRDRDPKARSLQKSR